MIQRILNLILKKTYYYFDFLYMKKWANYPLIKSPLSNKEHYKKLHYKQVRKTYQKIDKYEKLTCFFNR